MQGREPQALHKNAPRPYNRREEVGMEISKELDARGLNCPLPILKAKKALAELASGDVLKVLATDPGSVRDFQAFSKQTGNELIEQNEENAVFVHFIKRR
jgi:tRNA 2-thiouridine synthesizing protein A